MKCDHCGKGAGWFRRVHPDCQHKQSLVLRKLVEALRAALTTDDRPLSNSEIRDRINTLVDRITEINAEIGSAASASSLFAAVVIVWPGLARDALSRHPVSESAQMMLLTFAKWFDQEVGVGHLSGSDDALLLAKAGILRDLRQGKVPDLCEARGLPFVFEPGETLLWAFSHVDLVEERVHRSYVGGFAGASVRVAKGFSVRAGGFRGHPVEDSQVETVATDGDLAITDRHLYFSGSGKNFRIPYRKIVSIQPDAEGVIVTRDAAGAKPQGFLVGEKDGGFLSELLGAAARGGLPVA